MTARVTTTDAGADDRRDAVRAGPARNPLSEPSAKAGPAEQPVDLRLDRLSKSFGAMVAVRDVSFEAHRGEFISFLGPSGCGKTTTLAMIAGFQDPTGGSVWVRGRRIDRLPPEKRNTGMVFQNYALFPHMSVWDNVAFGLRMRNVAKEDLQRRVDAALDQVQMRDFADRRPAQLSGGQQQRVALARALVIAPHVLLLDEPFGALDRQLREQMQIELRTLQQAVGITTVFVTHDQDEALSMSDRIAVMNQGRIEQLGKPDEIYERPASIFVARFMGGSNFLSGRVQGVEAATAWIDTPIGRIAATGAFRPGDLVQCMIRPERFRLLAAGATPEGSNVAHGRLRQIAYHGPVTVLHIDLAEGIPFVARVDTKGLSETGGLDPRTQDIRIAWSASDTLVYVGDLLCQ